MERRRARWPERSRLALEFGASWEGDELVTYDLDSLVWPMEHLGDDHMIDSD